LCTCNLLILEVFKFFTRFQVTRLVWMLFYTGGCDQWNFCSSVHMTAQKLDNMLYHRRGHSFRHFRWIHNSS